MPYSKISLIIFCFSALLSGCQPLEMSKIYQQLPVSIGGIVGEAESKEAVEGSQNTVEDNGDANRDSNSLISLIDQATPSVDVDKGFAGAIRSAVDADPSIIAGRADLLAKKVGVEVFEKAKEFNVSGMLLGGIEDLSDEQAGLAAVLSANRMVYDGGQIDAQVLSESLSAEAAEFALTANTNKRAAELASIWIDLERYRALKELIDDRLEILNPLIVKLEQVAEAGMGDMAQVSAAQRTVSIIKATQLEVSEKLELAILDFKNSFGAVPSVTGYDSNFIDNLMPVSISSEMEQSSPALLSAYATYRSLQASVAAIEARDSVSVGFEARATLPVGNSSADREERIGLVLQKTIYNGKIIETEVEGAKARVSAALSSVKAVYREGLRQVNSASKTVASMDSAILLARKNAKVTADEISYLRKQLIIGGSSLDTVLSAEARLYDAESQEINFIADKRKAQLAILGYLGLLASAVGLS